MNENTEIKKRALLAAADLGEYDAEVSIEELRELAETAGLEVAAVVIQKRDSLETGTCLGEGKLIEIKELCAADDIELIIFDHELSGTQLRNIEKICDAPVIDRTMLILDIFAGRAKTSEGRLQVELAQLKYRLPRIGGMGVILSRLGGGIGTCGPGETKLESDRRHIRRRIDNLKEKLDSLESRRLTIRKKRRADGFVTAAIVGYTNVGKSTLLNAMTGAEVEAKDMLFATLDPTSRALDLPDGRRIIMTDTVGFIRRLPHHLVEAFKSTLEEAVYADLILNVCDASAGDALEQLDVTQKLLDELGTGDIPVLTVFNKCDKAIKPDIPFSRQSVTVSAKTGEGLEELSRKIAEMIAPTQRRLKLVIPYGKEQLINRIREEGKIFTQEFTESGNLVDALVDIKLLKQVEEYIILS